MSGNEKVTVKLCFLHQTPLAILVNNDGTLEDGVWLAKSTIEWEDEVYPRGTMIEVTAPKWLLKKKGLDDDNV